MTTESIATTLFHFGLDERQQKVYLALLELGADSVQNIAKKAGIERTGVYGILQSLMKMGLISETIHGIKRAFRAENPDRLLEILKEKEEVISSALPELQSLWQKQIGIKPKIRFYEGIEGMRTVLEDTLTAKNKKNCAILSAQDIYQAVGVSWMEKLIQKRVSEKITLNVIRPKFKEVKPIGEHWPSNPKDLRELRYAPETMTFSMSQYIYDNKVLLLSSTKENFGLIIESEEFAQNQRNFFEALWQISKPS